MAASDAAALAIVTAFSADASALTGFNPAIQRKRRSAGLPASCHASAAQMKSLVHDPRQALPLGDMDQTGEAGDCTVHQTQATPCTTS